MSSPERQPLDINDIGTGINDDVLNFVDNETDPQAEFNVKPAPAPDGPHNLRITLADLGTDGQGNAKSPVNVKTNPEKNGGRPYIALALDVQFDEPGEPWHNQFCKRDYSVTGIVQPDKGTSKLADLMRVIGQPFERGMTIRQQIEHIKSVFGGAALLEGVAVGGRTRWVASYKDDTTVPTTYPELYKGMKHFPPKFDPETGEQIGYEHLVDNPTGGDPIAAQAEVTSYLPRIERESGEIGRAHV